MSRPRDHYMPSKFEALHPLSEREQAERHLWNEMGYELGIHAIANEAQIVDRAMAQRRIMHEAGSLTQRIEGRDYVVGRLNLDLLGLDEDTLRKAQNYSCRQKERSIEFSERYRPSAERIRDKWDAEGRGSLRR